jgi:hypothetical protein
VQLLYFGDQFPIMRDRDAYVRPGRRDLREARR